MAAAAAASGPTFIDSLIAQSVSTLRTGLTNAVNGPLSTLTGHAPESRVATSQLVLLVPLLGATTNLTFALASWLHLRPFFPSPPAPLSSRSGGGASSSKSPKDDIDRELERALPATALQAHWSRWWLPALGVVATCGIVSIGGGLRAALRTSGTRRIWFGFGTAFAAGHFIFAPSVSPGSVMVSHACCCFGTDL